MSGTAGLSEKVGVQVATITVHRQDQPLYAAAKITFNTGPVTQADLVFVWGGGLLGGGSTWGTVVNINRRTKSNGVWSAPVRIAQIVRSQRLPKTGFGFNEAMAGIYEDVEYSMQAQTGSGSGIPAQDSTVASDFFFTSQIA